jgi:hypothetical protein
LERKGTHSRKKVDSRRLAKAAFSVDEGSVGGKKASIGAYQIALESFLIAGW